MYSNDDIDRFLIESRKQKEMVLSKVSEVASGQDALVIQRAINNSDFVAEDFYRYDSDVCERFLALMEKTILNNNSMQIIKIWSGSLDMEYEVIKTDAPVEEIEKAIYQQETDEKMLNEGVPTMMYAEHLERKGYSVEIIDGSDFSDDQDWDNLADAIIDVEETVNRLQSESDNAELEPQQVFRRHRGR